MIKPFFATLALLLAAGTVALAADSIDAIMAAPATYDGKHVDVTGTAKHVKMKTSKAGNDYVVFDLCQTQCVGVYEHGHPAGVIENATLTISGTFSAVKKMRTFEIHNQIDASDTGS